MSDSKTRPPEWANGTSDDGFASHVMAGVKTQHDGMSQSSGHVFVATNRPPQLSIENYVNGIRNGERGILARAITLVESNKPQHQETAQAVLQELLPDTGKSLRVGITGVPGAGKSTFIEAVGCNLCAAGHKVAVLAVDPSSTVTKGSILGDKTRMERLTRELNAFIRPSPSNGTLGGVGRKSRETMLLCEAAGYDVILVETVGVGQSEVTVRSMVDCFLLVVLTGAGDELQGMKKGIMELADIITINKADGDNKQRAMLARSDYERILHYLRPATEGWNTPALTCSATTGYGIEELWDTVKRFAEVTKVSGIFDIRRQKQALSWMHSMVEEHLYLRFYGNENVKRVLPLVEQNISNGSLVTTRAVQKLLDAYENK